MSDAEAENFKRQLLELAKNLQLLKGRKSKAIIMAGMREAMIPVQRVIAAQYLQHIGKHDFNQTPAQIRSRWGGGRTIHPIGESRQHIGISILRTKNNALKGIRKASDGTPNAFIYKVWGKTQNSWLVNFGRYKSPAEKYRGWGLFESVFNILSSTVQQKMIDKVKEGMDKAANQFWKDFARIGKPSEVGTTRRGR
jgi:hypothetical protein